MPKTKSIAIRGAGVVGLWQALTLARRGHRVTLCERSPVPFAHACSLYAGAMLAPNCERETGETMPRDLGLRGIALWRDTYPGAIANGTLVVALHRDRSELDRFARMTEGHQRLSPEELAKAEPALIDRFSGALYYPEEAHLSPAAGGVALVARQPLLGVLEGGVGAGAGLPAGRRQLVGAAEGPCAVGPPPGLALVLAKGDQLGGDPLCRLLAESNPSS